jgi:ribokinase
LEKILMRLLNFGSLNLDYVYSVERFVQAGETVSSLDMNVFCGGKGLNQSISFARAGADIYHAGFAGKSDGGMLIALLEESGVNTRLIKKLDMPGGHAIIQVDKSGQNCIMLYGGANRQNSAEYIDYVLSGFKEGDFVFLQNEINLVDEIIKKAKGKGLIVALNPSPLNETVYEMPLELVDFFAVNEIEATGICRYDSSERRDRNERLDCGGLMDNMRKKYPNASILLTLGSGGAEFYDKPGNRVIKQGIYKVPVVDTTGAGDTFTGYFFANLAAGVNPENALNTAAAASALSVSKKGAAAAIPTAGEVSEFLKNRCRWK